MDSARLTYLFHRYINQTCTADEREEFLKLVQHPESEVQVRDLMRSLWDSSRGDEPLPAGKADLILSSILDTANMPQPSRRMRWQPVLVGAMAVLMLLCGTLYYINSTSVAPARQAENVPVHDHQVIKLPDGSVVVLNAGSFLEYPPTFTGNTREVSLTGEGYFDIRHDAARPFIVHTGKLNTTVLGTAFNIKAYPSEENIVVTVTRGKVRVSDEQKIIGVITPDQQITFEKNQHTVWHQQVDSRQTIAWSDRDMYFDDRTLADVAAALEERFGVDIQFEDSTAGDCRITATFIRGEDLEQILTVICEFNGSHYTRNGTAVHIRGGGCLRGGQ